MALTTGWNVQMCFYYQNKLLGIAVMKNKNLSKMIRQWLVGCAVGLLGLSISSFASAVSLVDVEYTSLKGNVVEVRMKFDGAVPDVDSYSIEKPARIALDLEGASSSLPERNQNIDTGPVRRLSVVEAKDKTRMIFSLSQLVGYDTKVEGDTLVFTVGGEDDKPAVFEVDDDEAETASGDIKKVDFKRGTGEEGSVVVDLAKTSTSVDVREEANGLKVRFIGASAPKRLQKNLDVADFGTPVRNIQTRQVGNDTEMTISMEGEWEYLAYQADRAFSIDVKPYEEDKKKSKYEEPEYTGDKLSLNFQNIEVRSVLQLIADFTGLNLVASDTVGGSITLRLQNVPWDQALDLILKTKGLDQRKVGDVLLVGPASEIAAREKQEMESRRQLESLAPLRTEYIRINYAVAKDLESLIKAESSNLLTERGSVAVDERTNTLIVNDVADKIEEIREVLTYLDVAVQQVLIEARVVIATSDLTDELGIRWGGSHNHSAGSGSVSMSGGLDNDMVVDFGRENSEASSFTLGFTDKKSNLLDLEIFALASEGFGEVVATPKVLTADQQSAEIASGKEIPYQSSSGNQGTNTEFKEAELLLRVTPRITPEGRINMELEVTNDSVGEIFAGVPSIDTNRVETTVLVEDGETVVLGGIFQQTRNEGVYKTPFFGDLPWIGRLFRREYSTSKKDELLVFITPRLVAEDFVGR